MNPNEVNNPGKPQGEGMDYVDAFQKAFQCWREQCEAANVATVGANLISATAEIIHGVSAGASKKLMEQRFKNFENKLNQFFKEAHTHILAMNPDPEPGEEPTNVWDVFRTGYKPKPADL